MKKITLILPLLLLTLVFMSGSVSAAEITPAADSYSFGSTSEMSASGTYDEEPAEDSLADTGTGTPVILVTAGALVIIGVFALRRSSRSA